MVEAAAEAMPELTDPRGPSWTVWVNLSGVPVFAVDDDRSAVLYPNIVFEVTRGSLTAYYTISPTDPRITLFFREGYRPTKWERLLA